MCLWEKAKMLVTRQHLLLLVLCFQKALTVRIIDPWVCGLFPEVDLFSNINVAATVLVSVTMS